MSSEHATLTPISRKVIHAAEVLVIQPDGDVAATWRDALLDFGMNGVSTVADIHDALSQIRSHPPAGIVVALPSQAEAHAFMARLTEGEAGDMEHVPVVLVIPQPTRSAVVAAANAGFDAVLPYPLPPRLIYRRMGSLMQKARRVARQRQSPHLSVVENTADAAGLSVWPDQADI